MVGLANADNTSDANKPVSTATSTALALKSNLASPTFTGTVGGITKSMVGLGNCDNTSDLAKPVSTATSTALNLKVNSTGGTLTNGVANKLNIYNVGGANMNVSAGNCFGTIGSNFSNGDAEVSIISSDYSYPYGLCCAWYTYTSSIGNAYVNLMSLNRVGNLSVVGTITSPTITTINSNIALKQDIINSSNRLDASNIGTGIVSNTEYNYLDGVTSAIQTQFTGKQDAITTSNRLDAALVGTGAVTTTVYNFLSGVTSSIQTQLNTHTTAIATINSTLTGYATSFTTNYLNLINGQMVINVDQRSTTVTYNAATTPMLTVLTGSCNIRLPPAYTFPAGFVWAVMLFGGYTTTIDTAIANNFWYAGGFHQDFVYSNANKRKQFTVVGAYWTVMED